MSPRPASALRVLAFSAVVLVGGRALAAPVQPEPYEMVRSLRNLQDRIAAGRAEALPLLRLLLARIGREFRDVDQATWVEPRNRYAAVTYLLNGGNPDAVRAALDTPGADPGTRKLLDGALAYSEGDPSRMLTAFGGIEPGKLPFDLLDSIYLVSAGPLSSTDPLAALGRLDYVRLTAPGSLLEEAAIRRSLGLAGKVGDAGKVRIMARNYLTRFGQSPYLEDFLTQLADGIVALRDKISDEEIVDIASFAPDRVRGSFYLRLARSEILGGQPARAEFAADKASELAKQLGAESLQAKLYSAIGGVATPDVEDAAKRLAAIPDSQLHPADAVLRDAALTLAREITSAPPRSTEAATMAQNAPQDINAPAIEETPKRQADMAAFNATVGKAADVLSQVDQLLGEGTK